MLGSRPLILVLMGILIASVLAACGGDDRPPEEQAGVDTPRGDTVAVVDSLVDAPGDGVPDANGAPSEGAARDEDDPPAEIPGRDVGGADGEQVEGDRADESDDRPGGSVAGGGEPPIESEAPLRATYQLASVEGESLPVTIGEGPECDLQLVHGDLRIDDNLEFVLRTTVHHVCGGERAGEELHTAEGSVARDGPGLRFEARYESLFATAHGRRLVDGTIVIDRLETEGESHEVEWRFLR